MAFEELGEIQGLHAELHEEMEKRMSYEHLALDDALREVIYFFDRVKASTEDERIAVGRGHWDFT